MTLPGPEKSRALLFGSALYDDENLTNLPAVENNLHDLASELFKIIEPRNCRIISHPRTPDIGIQLESMAEAATDTLLVYYAGHGIPTSTGDLHLALPSTDTRYVHFTALDFKQVRRAMLASNARNKIMILDCCFSGRAIEAMGDPGALVAGETEIFGGYTLTSAGRNVTSVAPAGHRHTAFTGALIDCLREGPASSQEFLTLQDIYLAIRRRQSARGFPKPQQSGTGSILGLALSRSSFRSKSLNEPLVSPSKVAGSEPHPLLSRSRKPAHLKADSAEPTVATSTDPLTVRWNERRIFWEKRIDSLRGFERQMRSRTESYFNGLVRSIEIGEPIDVREVSSRFESHLNDQITELHKIFSSAPPEYLPQHSDQGLVRKVEELEAFTAEYRKRLNQFLATLLKDEESANEKSFSYVAANGGTQVQLLESCRAHISDLTGNKPGGNKLKKP